MAVTYHWPVISFQIRFDKRKEKTQNPTYIFTVLSESIVSSLTSPEAPAHFYLHSLHLPVSSGARKETKEAIMKETDVSLPLFFFKYQ